MKGREGFDDKLFLLRILRHLPPRRSPSDSVWLNQPHPLLPQVFQQASSTPVCPRRSTLMGRKCIMSPPTVRGRSLVPQSRQVQDPARLKGQSSHQLVLLPMSLQVSSHQLVLLPMSLQVSSHQLVLLPMSLQVSSHQLVLLPMSLQVSSHQLVLLPMSLQVSSHQLVLLPMSLQVSVCIDMLVY